jgi:hypothetical protein
VYLVGQFLLLDCGLWARLCKVWASLFASMINRIVRPLVANCQQTVPCRLVELRPNEIQSCRTIAPAKIAQQLGSIPIHSPIQKSAKLSSLPVRCTLVRCNKRYNRTVVVSELLIQLYFLSCTSVFTIYNKNNNR